MNFKIWLENSEKDHWKIKFKDVKFDPVEKYYADLNQALHNIPDINKVKIGEKIEDLVISKSPYWKVIGADDKKNTLYLEPIGKNPYVPNEKGQVIGAGGNVFSKHDFDVLSGEYENKRIDQLLDVINNRSYHDIKDVAYILLGTVPVQIGPNGAQGGWYNSIDYNNRGHYKNLRPKEIMMKDAETLKTKLHLHVPQKALDGSLDPYEWNHFVNGDTDYNPKKTSTHLDIENFKDPKKMSEIILSHKQPQIRMRNASALLYQDETTEVDDIIKQTAFQIAKQTVKSENLDVLWHLKEMFINYASRRGWTDVLTAFHDAHDPTNRSYVVHALTEKEFPLLEKMLQKEKNPQAFRAIISKIFNIILKPYHETFKSKWFSPFSFTQFVKNYPDQAKIINQEFQRIYPLIQQKYNEIKSSVEPDDYYMNDVEMSMKGFRYIADSLKNS